MQIIALIMNYCSNNNANRIDRLQNTGTSVTVTVTLSLQQDRSISECFISKLATINFKCQTMPARMPHRVSSIASTFSAESRDLRSVIILPTEEKSRSEQNLLICTIFDAQ